MARPVVHTTTERIYERLPKFYLDGDEAQAEGSNGYPLLRFLALMGNQVGEVEDILDRIEDLADPESADDAWLPWLGQFFGVRASEMAPAEARVAIAESIASLDVGSSRSLLAAVRARLSGDQRAELVRHLDGDMWRLGVLVHPDDVQTVSWTALEAGFPDWDSIESAGSWDALGDIDPIATASVRAAKPAGVELVIVPVGSWWAIESLGGTWVDIEALGSWSAIESAPF